MDAHEIETQERSDRRAKEKEEIVTFGYRIAITDAIRAESAASQLSQLAAQADRIAETMQNKRASTHLQVIAEQIREMGGSERARGAASEESLLNHIDRAAGPTSLGSLGPPAHTMGYDREWVDPVDGDPISAEWVDRDGLHYKMEDLPEELQDVLRKAQQEVSEKFHRQDAARFV